MTTDRILKERQIIEIIKFTKQAEHIFSFDNHNIKLQDISFYQQMRSFYCCFHG